MASGADILNAELAIGSNEATIQAAAENGDAVAEAVEDNLAMNDAMKYEQLLFDANFAAPVLWRTNTLLFLVGPLKAPFGTR